MPKISIGTNNSSKTDAQAEYGVNISFYGGNITGNIIDSTPTECLQYSLEFTCPDNSQYISLT